MAFLPLLLQGRLFKQIVLAIYICGNVVFLIAFLAAISQIWNKSLSFVMKYCAVEKTCKECFLLQLCPQHLPKDVIEE